MLDVATLRLLKIVRDQNPSSTMTYAEAKRFVQTLLAEQVLLGTASPLLPELLQDQIDPGAFLSLELT